MVRHLYIPLKPVVSRLKCLTDLGVIYYIPRPRFFSSRAIPGHLIGWRMCSGCDDLSSALPLERHPGCLAPIPLSKKPAPKTVQPSAVHSSLAVPNEWALSEKLQPYFKLHGSSNWVDGHGVQLLVMGGNKSTTIQQHEILRRYFEIFVEYLSSEDVRLMVIGYNFGDGHINRVILDSTLKNGLKLFIADPAGESVTDKISANASRNGMPRERFIVGISNSKLNETFGGNAAEHGKMTRFFQ